MLSDNEPTASRNTTTITVAKVTETAISHGTNRDRGWASDGSVTMLLETVVRAGI